jgi:hypothetical protein
VIANKYWDSGWGDENVPRLTAVVAEQLGKSIIVQKQSNCMHR